MFIPFYQYLGREWYGPYSLFYFPFLICYLIAAYNANSWEFELGIKTFFALLLGEFAFLFGCVIAKKVSIRGGTSRERVNLFHLEGKSNKISSNRLSIIVFFEFVFFMYYFIKVYIWGIQHGRSIIEAINSIMLNGKFDGDGDPLGLPFWIQIFLQMNYIAGYLFAYLIARRILLKDRTNILLLCLGYFISMLTNFLGGSRGPILEILGALLISFGITYYFKTSKRFFPIKTVLKIVIIVAIVGIGFFEILPLMGRSQTAANESDVFTQYIGSQIYNLNYFIENVDTHSTFFCAETLKSFYADIESFTGLNIGYKDGMIGNFYVFTSNGHNLGNVFTTYYNFYIDFGMIGIFIFTAFIGWFSELFFKHLKYNENMVNFKLILYIYMASSIMFSFFASRFFQNVIQLKMLIKLFWLLIMYLYLVNGSYLRFKIGYSVKFSLNRSYSNYIGRK